MHPKSILAGALAALAAGCLPAPTPPTITGELPGTDGCMLPDGFGVPAVPLIDGGDGDALFADDALPLFELRLTDAQWASVCANAEEYADFIWDRVQGNDPPRVTHAYTRANARFQGVDYPDIGVRFRGRTTAYQLFYDRADQPRPNALQRCLDRQLAVKPSWKLSLDEFGVDQEIADQQSLNLISREGIDGAYLREALAQRISRRFGVVAPRVGHARLCVDGAYEGLFTLSEEADTQRFLNQNFPESPDGEYWKVEADGGQTWHDSWDSSGNWIGDYIPRAGTSVDDPGTLRPLLLAGSAADAGEPDATVDALLGDLVDREQWLREIAVDLALPDLDGMFGNHKNHLLYHHPEQGFVVIPYDRDLAFGELTLFGGACAGSIFGAHPCWSTADQGPAVARWLVRTESTRYVELVEELLDDAFAADGTRAWITARADAMRPWLQADRYYRAGSPACIDDPEICDYYSMSAWEYEVQTVLTGAIDARVAELRRQLDGGATCETPCPGR